jgi:rhodanese-related sulfurtransferase
MNVKMLTPQEVHTLLQTDPAVVYIDVRTVAEFALGHPRGRVVNVPFLFYHPTTKAVYPNTSFLLVLEDLCSKETPLVVGCDTGERAAQAAQRLLEAGYTNVTVMQDGFSGWRTGGLPVTTDNRDGISYVSHLTRVKRRGKKKTASAVE